MVKHIVRNLGSVGRFLRRKTFMAIVGLLGLAGSLLLFGWLSSLIAGIFVTGGFFWYLIFAVCMLASIFIITPATIMSMGLGAVIDSCIHGKGKYNIT